MRTNRYSRLLAETILALLDTGAMTTTDIVSFIQRRSPDVSLSLVKDVLKALYRRGVIKRRILGKVMLWYKDGKEQVSELSLVNRIRDEVIVSLSMMAESSKGAVMSVKISSIKKTLCGGANSYKYTICREQNNTVIMLMVRELLKEILGNSVLGDSGGLLVSTDELKQRLSSWRALRSRSAGSSTS